MQAIDEEEKVRQIEQLQNHPEYTDFMAKLNTLSEMIKDNEGNESLEMVNKLFEESGVSKYLNLIPENEIQNHNFTEIVKVMPDGTVENVETTDSDAVFFAKKD